MGAKRTLVPAQRLGEKQLVLKTELILDNYRCIIQSIKKKTVRGCKKDFTIIARVKKIKTTWILIKYLSINKPYCKNFKHIVL